MKSDRRHMLRKFFKVWFPLLAPLGLPGGEMNCSAQTTEVILFSLTNAWRYNQTVSYDGTNWTAPGFNDTALPSGRGVLAVEDNGNPFALGLRNTTLTLGRITYYFRTHFNFAGSTQGVSLTFSNLIDDGAVFHLNGREVARVNLPASPKPITRHAAAAPPCSCATRWRRLWVAARTTHS